MHLKGMDRLRSLWGYRNLNLNTDNDAYWSPREAVPKKFDYRGPSPGLLNKPGALWDSGGVELQESIVQAESNRDSDSFSSHSQLASSVSTGSLGRNSATAANKLASKEFWLRNPPYRGLSTYGSYGYREDYRNAAINSQEEDFRMLNDPDCNGASDSREPLQTRNMSHTQSSRPESQPSGLNQASRAQNTPATSTHHTLQTPQARMEQITGGVNQLRLQQVRTSNPGNLSSESNPSQGGSLTRTTRQQYQGGYQNAPRRQGTQYQYPNHRSSNSVAAFSFGPAPTPIQPASNSGIQAITIASLSAQLQTELMEVQKIVLKADGMPSDIREKLRDALRRLGQDYNASQRTLQIEWDKRQNEHDQISQDLNQANEKIASLLKRTASITAERDILLHEVRELHVRHKKSHDRISEIEANYQREQLSKYSKLNDFQFSTQGDGMNATQNPFETPTPLGLASSRQNQNSYAVSRPPSLLGGLSGSKPTYRHINRLSDIDHSNTLLKTTAEPGTPPGAAKGSMALTLHHSGGDYPGPSATFKEAVEDLFCRVEVWTRTNANQPNKEAGHLAASTNEDIWSLFLNVIYPGYPHDSHTYVTALLQNESDRFWTITRVLIEYFVKNILSISAFYGFSNETDDVLNLVKSSMANFRGLANNKRQIYVDQQATAIQDLVASDGFNEWRQNEINKHAKKLREILGPFLNVTCVRPVAGKELGDLIKLAWKVSVMMNTSHLSFQIIFPETGTKFFSATMQARDHSGDDQMTLQVAQFRVKLVIAPVITLRDDRGSNLRIYNIRTAHVLLMPA